MKLIPLFKLTLIFVLALVSVNLLAGTDLSHPELGKQTQDNSPNLATKAVNLIQDTAITAYLYAQIALDKNLSKLTLNVSTNAGVVTLDGTVDSNSEKKVLIELASSASGVKKVDSSKLSVKTSSQPFTDFMITAKVKSAFLRQKLFNGKSLPSDVHVETNNGVVYLNGLANTNLQAQNAIDLARSVSDVVRVESTMKVVNTQ